MLEQLGEDLPGTELEPDAYDVSVPSALQTSLMARLDRLWDVKGFTLSCAVIGREFSRELAAHVSSLREEDIDQALKKLIDAELVQPLSQYSNERYMFRHALLRDAAYNNLLRSRRRDIHSRVAEVLVQHYPKTVAMEPERLARHYAGAERYIDANEYYLVAGLKAAHGGATLEAVEHLQRGVDLLKYIEDDSARLPLELDLNLALGPALVAVRGFGAEEVEASFSRGRVLCNKIGASEKLLPALHGLMDYYIVRARFEDALEVAREFGEAMPRTNNVGHRLELQWSMGSANLFKGDVLEARELLEQGLPLYNREEHADHAVTYGQDPGVALMTHLAITLTLQGEYTRSREVEQRVMDLVSVLDHPLTKAQASVFLQGCAAIRGELNRTLELSEQCIGYCQEQGFPLFMGMATMYKGHYLCERGDDSGLALIYQGFDIYTLSGADVSTSLYLAMTAECELSCGTVERGLECIERAYQRVHNTGEWLYFPMLKYVEARLLLKRNQGRDALDACELMLDCVQRALAASTRHFAGQAAHHLVSLAPELPGGKQILVRLHACVPDVDELLALNREIVD
jgi:tetratricopeptide (TPR) repeat protein